MHGIKALLKGKFGAHQLLQNQIASMSTKGSLDDWESNIKYNHLIFELECHILPQQLKRKKILHIKLTLFNSRISHKSCQSQRYRLSIKGWMTSNCIVPFSQANITSVSNSIFLSFLTYIIFTIYLRFLKGSPSCVLPHVNSGSRDPCICYI